MSNNMRLERLRKYMNEKNIEIGLIFEPDNQFYISGFKAITYSRPIVTVVTKEKIELIVPGLEELHAKEVAKVDNVYVYYEIPEMKKHGISHKHYLDVILSKYPKGTIVGIEKDIVSASFSEYITDKSFDIKDIGSKIFEMRYVKDAGEIEFLKIAGYLSDIGIKGSLENVRVGMSELEFDVAGDNALLKYVSENYPDTYIGFANWTCSGIDRTAQPHLDSNTRILQRGDIVIHSRQVWYENYRAENERTFIIGKPTERQKEVFKIAVEAQQAGLDTIKAGIPARMVDEAARAVVAKYGLELYSNHRIGHGLGLSEHEEPYLRFDNELILEEGMVFSMEPGIYIPGVGGFRHSDTAIVGKNGSTIITNYPRSVEELILDI
ncbi:aminopeptidase P family protein [Clostridioides sp. ES-S-0108-01]|uniref:M24 family metallopeptidase n=1 Tax=Clostridioides sp. ES-S-0108-01 TaxID=2770773 RepID=UPI001D0CAB6E|nr:aminopeptidase P family protein [Clostridioides sp. ES-S-0108-01]UDN50280.1 aminopeptidase P family protein [Clostridioides sp. ES-S-0107-01]